MLKRMTQLSNPFRQCIDIQSSFNDADTLDLHVIYDRYLAKLGTKMALVTVNYKFGPKGPTATSNWTGTVQGTTESAILHEIKRQRPSHQNIVIINIVVKRP